MMVSVLSAAVNGLDVTRIRVEVTIGRGTPMIQIVGLASGAVREGRERIRAAASQLGLHLPGLRITVNLAPADVPKTGSALDLPITLGILAAAGQLPPSELEGTMMVGELGLDGALRPIRGALPIALFAARAPGVERLIVPFANLREAGAGPAFDVRGADTLAAVIDALSRGHPLPGPGDVPKPSDRDRAPPPDLAGVRGQAEAKRALEIAAAGGHNVLLVGAPGCGKTSLARCLPGLLPELTPAEAVAVTAIHSVAGLVPEGGGLTRRRPFRAPHHNVSPAGLIGGGPVPRPGEASLAHHGVLFLDELPEFGRGALESLRGPMEEGWVRIVRVSGSARFPAEFALVAAMNPCPCGYAGSHRSCDCSPSVVRRYRRRVSGPLLDRIDIRVEVPALDWDELTGDRSEEPSVRVRDRVCAARARAAERAGDGRAVPNARLSATALDAACRLTRGGRTRLRTAVNRLGMSARGYHRTLRVARTIADLAGSAGVTEDAVIEAIRYRGYRPAIR
ncbi:MAG: YifB family Mg chelatase-like AAA ATPase [Gemmatimonadetes bacterium]|nr:YifB family Mg chelatase-like AAA ATPase [Gemmatimonadota bacterium]